MALVKLAPILQGKQPSKKFENFRKKNLKNNSMSNFSLEIALCGFSDIRVALKKLKESMLRGIRRAHSPQRSCDQDKENRRVN
jgi:hypothetical protein